MSAPSSEGLNFLFRISNALHAIQAKYTAAFFRQGVSENVALKDLEETSQGIPLVP